jgi:hypothetical protein
VLRRRLKAVKNRSRTTRAGVTSGLCCSLFAINLGDAVPIAKRAVLMHYNTFGLIARDAEAVAGAIRQHTSSQPVLLKPGETLTVS